MVPLQKSSSKLSLWKWMLIFDQKILLSVRGWERRWLTPVMLTLTRLGDTSTYFAVGLTFLAAGHVQTVKYGTLLGVAAIMASIVAALIKRVFRRERPLVSIVGFSALVSIPDRYSFPSGHTATAFAVATALYSEGIFLGPLAFVTAGGIGASRVYLGAHYPLDVLMGATLGIVVGLFTRLALYGLVF